MNNLEKKEAIKKEIKEKTAQIQQLDQTKNLLITDIIRAEGKVQLLEEQEKETTPDVAPVPGEEVK